MILEICANSLQSAINAQAGGASRIELCENLWEGGTTPSYGTLKIAKKLIDIELLVLVRPRGGDFVYSELEFQVICEDILKLKEIGIDGIVSGVLDAQGNIDQARTKQLVALSHPLPFVFHRAFDCTPDPFVALQALIDCGVKRVLSSGQENSAIDGLPLIHQLHSRAAGRIEILPGGGLNKDNVKQLIAQNPCGQVHLTAKMPTLNKRLPHLKVNMNGSTAIAEEFIYETDVETVREVKRLMDEANPL